MRYVGTPPAVSGNSDYLSAYTESRVGTWGRQQSRIFALSVHAAALLHRVLELAGMSFSRASLSKPTPVTPGAYILSLLDIHVTVSTCLRIWSYRI